MTIKNHNTIYSNQETCVLNARKEHGSDSPIVFNTQVFLLENIWLNSVI